MVVSRAATVCSHSAILMVNKADTVNSSSINSHNGSNTSSHSISHIKARTNNRSHNRNSLAATAWVNLHKVGMVVTAACRMLTRRNNTVNKVWVNPNNLVECIKAFRYKFGVGGFI